MEQLVLAIAGCAAIGVVGVVRAVTASRRRRRVTAGRGATTRARLAIDTSSLRAGRLWTDGATVSWRGGRSWQVDLTGSTDTSVRVPGPRGLTLEGDVTLHLVTPRGVPVRLQLHESEAAQLVRTFRSGGMRASGATPPTPRARRWPVVVLVLAVAWLVGWGWLVASGCVARATVVGRADDDLCLVVWADDDVTRSDWVDCLGHQGDAVVEVLALGPPSGTRPSEPACSPSPCPRWPPRCWSSAWCRGGGTAGGGAPP